MDESSDLLRTDRRLGPWSTGARVLVGVVLLALAVADGPRAWDVLLGLVGVNGALYVVLSARGASAPPLRFTGGAGHLVNCGLIVSFYALNPTAANLFYGSTMLLAAARGYRGCELLAVWNWLRRRDDEVGCPFFLPVDTLDRSDARTP